MKTDSSYSSQKTDSNRSSRACRRACFTLLFAALISTTLRADRVDLLVVYTPAVTSIHNSHDGVLAHILTMVSGANQAYEDSGIDQTLHLVHATEIEYTEESSMGEDLDNLTHPSDGLLDEAHSLRDAWGADLVCLLQNGGGGIAWLLNNENGSASYGFSVVGSYGAAAGAVLPHELGHNMGGHHDRLTAKTDSGLYPDSYGHRFTGNDGVLYRTIMAYTPGQRIFRFSNPDLSYAGVPTGIALPDAESANNARTIQMTSPVISAYRIEVPQSPAFISEPSDLKSITGNTITLQTLALGSPPLSIQWYEGIAGDTSRPIDGATKQGLELTVTAGLRSFWARAYNGQSHADSRVATVGGIDVWPKSVAVDQTQTTGYHHWPHSPGQRYWQEFVPSMPYLHAVTLYVTKVGTASSFRFRLLNHLDLPILEKEVILTGDSGQSVSLGIWVTPGQTYRIECDPGADSVNYVAWDFQRSGDAYPEGHSSFTTSYEYNDFRFQTVGGVNSTPVINPPSNATIQAGQTIQIILNATDEDQDNLEFSASGQ